MPKYLFILLFALVLSTACYAQKSSETSVPVFFEKTYLHTDRDVYAPGEDIWYKAYLLNAQNNVPLDYSHNLYVELISPEAKIISRAMLRMDKGLGNGDFKLSNTLPDGNYRLRAYTNWMRNFGDNFVFEKSISIIKLDNAAEVPVTAVAKKNNKKVVATTVTTIISADTIPLVRFFPEGGHMVNGLSSWVAVKAEDINGRGVGAAGDVVNNTGETVAHFNCDSLGFGLFTLLPDVNQHYQALVTINKQKRRYILPDVSATGFNLHVQVKDNISVAITCDEGTFNKINGQSLYLTAKHAGQAYVRKAIPYNSKEKLITMSAGLFPEGITCITIADAQAKPLAERLVYIHHDDGTQISLTADKPTYQAKEKVTVHIKLSEPQKANLSLAAVDAATVPVRQENIASYLNLRSEIKGNIEHSGRYFDTTNRDRFKQLDLLLLTQGWRGFIWKKLADTVIRSYGYNLEQGINITGRVTGTGGKKPLPFMNVTMRAPKAEGQKLFWTTTDSIGRFTINNPDPLFYGYQLLAFTSRKSDKINDEGRSKGNSGGWVQVDSLAKDTLPVNRLAEKKSYIPEIFKDTMTIEKLRKSFHIPDKGLLKEVDIKANKSRLRTMEVPQIFDITLKEQKEYSNLGQYLCWMIPESSIDIGGCRYCKMDAVPGRILTIHAFPRPRLIPIRGVYADHSAIDYCYVCQEDYMGLNMSKVLKVTITRFRDVYGLEASVAIVMRPGALEVKDYFDDATANMVGYYPARIFYAPKFGLIDDAYDPRANTIHWAPNITTDNNGEANVSFYTTGLKGKMRLVVEGVTDKGEPLATTISCQVK